MQNTGYTVQHNTKHPTGELMAIGAKIRGSSGGLLQTAGHPGFPDYLLLPRDERRITYGETHR